MSRKREKTKEQKAELARQLGVKASELDASTEELRAHARVCSPTMKASLDLTKAGLGLLRRRGPLALHLALYVVDGAGARLVRQQQLTGTAQKVPGPVSLVSAAKASDEERVRYSRPAHFLLLLVVTEGASEEETRAHAAALASAEPLSLEVALEDGSTKTHPLADKAFAAARFEVPRGVRVLVGGAPLSAPSLAAAVVSLPGVHRAKEQLKLALTSSDDRLRATASVDLRL